jgi:hypothetical protein
MHLRSAPRRPRVYVNPRVEVGELRSALFFFAVALRKGSLERERFVQKRMMRRKEGGGVGGD